jgi:hypothetical protein
VRTTKRTDAGTAPYAHLAGGFLDLGPAVLPGSAARFYRGNPPAQAGVPLHGSPGTVPGETSLNAVKRARPETGAAGSTVGSAASRAGRGAT